MLLAAYYGHRVTIVRRGAKNTRIRFDSGRTKVVPNEKLSNVYERVLERRISP